MPITERDLRIHFASAGAVRKRKPDDAAQIAKRRALADRAAAENRQVGGPDSLVKRVERGEEDRPWWLTK
jgi:hypothetical protein